MLPLRELPLSVFPLSGVGCGAATRRLYPTHHLRLFICFFFAPAKGLPYIWSSVCCSYAKEKTNFPFFFKCFISGWVRINLVLYAFATGESEFKTRNKTRTRYEPFTHECCSRLFMRRQHMFVLKLDSLTHSFTHQVILFSFSTLFSSDSCLSVKNTWQTGKHLHSAGAKRKGKTKCDVKAFFM